MIGSICFQDDARQAKTMNETWWRAVLKIFFWLELNFLGRDDLWFRQDGATFHTAAETIRILKTRFQGLLIYQNVDAKLPTSSPDSRFSVCEVFKDRYAPKCDQKL